MQEDSTELETRFCHWDVGYSCVGMKQLQHLSSSGNVIVSDSELICLIWQCGCIWAHLADLAGTGSIPGGGFCQESRARGARTGAGDVMELRQAHASTAADGDPMQIKPRHRSATTSTHANNCGVRVKIHVITILKHCHYPGLEWMWLRSTSSGWT